MEKNFEVFKRKQDIGLLISQLHRKEQLAIGIMDTGTPEELESSLCWFRDNMNFCLHVISDQQRIKIQQMSELHPEATFILFNNSPSLAERINTLADECLTTYFLLIRSDVALMSYDAKYLMKLLTQEEQPVALCPQVFNKSQELIPTVRAPHLQNKIIDPISFSPTNQPNATLYPFLGMGLYPRALFQRLRGFDNEIEGAYWQSMDFGIRCWLYGYPIYTVPYMTVLFPNKQFLIENRSERAGTKRCYTRALSVHQLHGKNFVMKSRGLDSKLIKQEIKQKISLYKTDFSNLCSDWKLPDYNN